MVQADREFLEQRVLILTPTGRDARLTQSVLEGAGITCRCCPDLVEVCQELEEGAGALLLAEEATATEDTDCLTSWLARQPQWSDLPVLMLARPGAESPAVMRALDLFGNVSVLERPTRVAALVSIVRTALRSRRRQYQARDHLAERERSIEAQRCSPRSLPRRTMRSSASRWTASSEAGTPERNAFSAIQPLK